ncbi:MAG TPA: MlaD family protein [Candidatus Binataceae bacterium]|nr:MlaD family protein [Candidatus Binataceae bacterium]
MGKRFSPTLVGGFVLGALGLAIIAIVVLGSGRFFTGKTSYVLYFDRDVNGLRVGAPVKFRGVDIGTVDAVLLSLSGFEAQNSNAAPNVKIPVIIDIDSKKIESRGAQDDLSDPEVMRHAIDLGLRGMLSMQSFVTGVLYVDLDMHPGTEAKFSMNALEGKEERYQGIQEIPVLPTALEQAQETLTRVVEELGKADIPGLIHSLSLTAQGVSNFVNSTDLKGSVDELGVAAKNLSAASVSIRNLSDNLNRQVGPIGANLTQSAKEADNALRAMQVTLASVQHTIEPQSPLNYQIAQTLQDLSSAANAVQELADMLHRNPSVLLRGRFIPTERH